MKKILAVLFTVGLVFGLSACGGDSAGGNGGNGGSLPKPEDSAGTVIDALNAAADTVVTVEGVVSAIVYGAGQSQIGSYITDSTGTVYVYGKDFAATVAKGDHVIVSAKAAVHNGYRQISWPELKEKVGSNVAVPTSAAQEKTIGDIKANLANLGCNTFKVKVTVEKTSYGGYELKGTDGELFSCYSSGSNNSEFNFLDQYTGEITVVLTVQGQTGSEKPRGHVLAVL